MKDNQLTSSEIKYLRILTKKHILLPTKFKKPLIRGWNKFYAEKRSIEQLLELNSEYSLRTGTKIGDYYFIVIDLDDIWAKERIKTSRYVETSKGIHRYILIKELPKSCWLSNSNGDRIGEIHSKGRFVVGIGSIHESGKRYSLWGRVNLSWRLKMESLKELQEFLTAREILTTPWGKKGLENVRDLEPYQSKLNSSKSPILTPAQKYWQKKKKLEKRANSHPKKEDLNICYICLVYFPKTSELIKAHLLGKKHQKNWKVYQKRKSPNIPNKTTPYVRKRSKINSWNQLN